MTEIPEHLLKASAAARARLSGEAVDSAPAAGAAAPAIPAASTPVPAAAPPVPDLPAEPDPVAPYVEAALARKTVPVWIIPVLLFLPFWAVYYVGYLERPPASPEGLAFEGAEVYASKCASCHGGTGGGGTGRKLNGGEVLVTFPSTAGSYDGLAGHVAWVINGTSGTQINEGANYGDPGRADGQRETASFGTMGSFGTLSIEDLVASVYYERLTHGMLDDETAAAELAVLEAFIEIREESGATEWSDETVDEITEQLDEARNLAASESEGETAAG